jgi:hypothetical protein
MLTSTVPDMPSANERFCLMNEPSSYALARNEPASHRTNQSTQAKAQSSQMIQALQYSVASFAPLREI